MYLQVELQDHVAQKFKAFKETFEVIFDHCARDMIFLLKSK